MTRGKVTILGINGHIGHHAAIAFAAAGWEVSAVGALQGVFGNDAAAISRKDSAKNAKIQISTYQTLGLDDEDLTSTSILESYPEDYFSHIFIDECHRSAWGDWSRILERNSNAIQIGLTATPRQLKRPKPAAGAVVLPPTPEVLADEAITRDNLVYFGTPVYEYSLEQGREDGYLAACEIIQRDIFLDGNPLSEREAGLTKKDLLGKTARDTRTGEAVPESSLRDWYKAQSFERRLALPDRVKAVCEDFFNQPSVAGRTWRSSRSLRERFLPANRSIPSIAIIVLSVTSSGAATVTLSRTGSLFTRSMSND